jgi:hypothetical protein
MSILSNLVSAAIANDTSKARRLLVVAFDRTHLRPDSPRRLCIFRMFHMPTAAGACAGSSIVFLPCDFTLPDGKSRILSSLELIQNSRRATHLHVRFGFDMSPQNLTISSPGVPATSSSTPSSLPFPYQTGFQLLASPDTALLGDLSRDLPGVSTLFV